VLALSVRMDKELGEGTYGRVFRATVTPPPDASPRTRAVPRLVAVKVFTDARDAERIFEARYEAKIMRLLPPHPNIVGLRFVADSDYGRRSAIGIDYMCAGNLHTYTNTTTYSDRLLKSYAYQLLRGIAHCHAHGVIHCDVKCDNVVIDRFGALKLCDFGVAYAHGHTTRDEVCDDIGTLAYRAPEALLRAADAYTGAVDVWAAACSIYYMITRTFPFTFFSIDLVVMCQVHYLGAYPEHLRHKSRMIETSVALDTAHQRLSRQGVESNPDALFKGVSAEQRSLLSTMFVLDPEARPSASEVMKHPWFDEVRDLVEHHIPV
jgi:serine/threonine protein kinase